MNALPGMPATPADVWSGDGVRHVSAVARLLVPDHPRPASVATKAGRQGARVPRPRRATGAQPAAKTPAG
jgi:hypothetical protein